MHSHAQLNGSSPLVGGCECTGADASSAG